MQGILISVRHRWAELEYRKEKLYELRKTAPRSAAFLVQPWRPVYIYEPERRAVTGVAGFGGEFSSRAVEQMVMLPLGLSEEEIEGYGPGRDGSYHAWRLEGAEKYLTPFPLAHFGLKRPPQSWQYVHFERSGL